MMPVTTATPDDNNPCTTYGGILIGDAGVDRGPSGQPTWARYIEPFSS
jgi:hypothetical protein